MSNTLETLERGAQDTLGGEGFTDIPIPALGYRARADLIAYHNGYGSGDDYAGLLVSMKGIKLGNPEDRKFENYYLELRRTMIIAPGTATKFEADFPNNRATTTIKGLIVTITHV